LHKKQDEKRVKGKGIADFRLRNGKRVRSGGVKEQGPWGRGVKGQAAGSNNFSSSRLTRARITVTNNDILKKLRIALELKDTDIIEILRLADFEVSSSELSALFRNPENKNYRECGDQLLRRFLDGLIIKRRGVRRRRLVRNIQKPGS